MDRFTQQMERLWKARGGIAPVEFVRIELPRCRGEARRSGPGQAYETLRRWFLKFGPVIAANLHRTRPRPGDRWRLDEMVIVIRRKRTWLWRALDHEGEVPDFLVQRWRDAKVSQRLNVYVIILVWRVTLM